MKAPRLLRFAFGRIEAGTSGYLEGVGWVHTRVERTALDREGRPIPWFTYPAIAFLDERVTPGLRVLEYGAGMGTLWWARHVSDVVAVEHDAGWARRISQQCRAQILEVSPDDPDEYVAAGTDAAPFDAIIVDGLFRVECLRRAPSLLSADGVIVLDDSQRPEYRPGIDEVVGHGFKSLPFHGPQPVSKHAGCTTIFYRDGNILGL